MYCFFFNIKKYNRAGRFKLSCLGVAAFLAVHTPLAGCGSTNAAREYPRTPSYALPQGTDTAFSRALADRIAAYPGKSGFRLLTTGSESFAMRLALIEAAEKTLDLQYYSIHDDTTSNLLLEALVRAAQRGVRIRILLDDIGFDDDDYTFSVLDGLKNIEIRVFNPFVMREDGLLARTVGMLTDLERINRRMHNKALIGDNQLAIIGGRNLGDVYFEEDPDIAFNDLDILIAGTLTADISRSFDSYWNHEESIPLGQVKAPTKNQTAKLDIREKLATQWQETLQSEKGRKILESSLPERLKQGKLDLIWAPGEVVADRPHKVKQEAEEAESRPLMRLDKLLDRASREFIAITSYFVPREEGVEWLAGLTKRGMRVRILTNSLASTDVVAVHTAYWKYRAPLLAGGVELYEMKPVNRKRSPQRLIGSKAPPYATLHSKVYVIDRREVMIGSFNLDPRSIELNTELTLVIHSPALAKQVVAIFADATAPENSYRLMLEDTGGGKARLVWRTREKGKYIEFYQDPRAGFWRTLQVGVMGLLPIEDYL